MILSIAYCVTALLYGVLFTCGFQYLAPTASRQDARQILVLLMASVRDDDESSKPGYKFGDITKGLLKKTTSSINGVTGKDEYTFGDLSRWVDSKVKQRVNNITGEEEYVFGDLSRWADSQVKAKISNYTGKDEYVMGDVSKEIIRRVSTGEYAIEDVVFLCKALLTFGVGLTPVAGFLPAKLLLEMIQFGLAEQVGGRLMGALTKTLDERFKETVIGDKNYRLGDKTKQAVQNLMTMATQQDSTYSQSKGQREVRITDSKMDSALLAELEDWDRRLGIAASNEKSAVSATKSQR